MISDPGPLARGAAGVLRRVALHEETAALLQQRAERSAPEKAAPLRRRAAEHARQAAELRAALVARRSDRRPAPRGEVTGT